MECRIRRYERGGKVNVRKRGKGVFGEECVNVLYLVMQSQFIYMNRF